MKKSQEFDVGRNFDAVRKLYLTAKLLLYFLIVNLSMVHANVFSQDRVSISVHESSLIHVFELLSKQT